MANEVTVGVRELKAHLSEYIDRAKNGEIVIVTERGTPVVQMQPVEPRPDDLRQRLLAMVAAGKADWNGEWLKPVEPTIVNTSGRLISDIIVEDRG